MTKSNNTEAVDEYEITITFKSGAQITNLVTDFNISKNALNDKSYAWIDADDNNKLLTFNPNEVAAVQSRKIVQKY